MLNSRKSRKVLVAIALVLLGVGCSKSDSGSSAPAAPPPPPPPPPEAPAAPPTPPPPPAINAATIFGTWQFRQAPGYDQTQVLFTITPDRISVEVRCKAAWDTNLTASTSFSVPARVDGEMIETLESGKEKATNQGLTCFYALGKMKFYYYLANEKVYISFFKTSAENVMFDQFIFFDKKIAQ